MGGKLFLTGRPGVGKTAVIEKTVQMLREKGLIVGGMISSEIRESGIRVGFQMVDILQGRRGILAHVRRAEGPRVGKYRVNLDDLNLIGAEAILKAVDEADVVVIDEVGPMELHSSAFREATKLAIRSGKPILGTIHAKARDPLIEEIKSGRGIGIVQVTPENRERLPSEIAPALLG